MCPKIVDDDNIVALERWRETGRAFRYAPPGRIRGAGGDGLARICYCAPGLTT